MFSSTRLQSMHKPNPAPIIWRRVSRHRPALWIPGLALTAAILTVAACSFQKTAPDPAQLEQQITDAKTKELELVRTTIEDPERVAQFIALLADRDRLIDSAANDVAQHRQAMARLNADYNAERTDFDALLADYNQKRAAAQTSFVTVVAEMKASTTAEEWRVISRFQTNRLNLRRLAYRSTAGETTP